ncbi:hypothetical protein [Methylovirgula sp. 4M-Z18]|uniref:hypothetical protein n=1 Tax=Methylovirgula sp. 4M-Z18 TaxID=2293567 RepID=UPI000E2E4A07|nr:hypothetical protein [Methylovirgula sp. 4M-Z18]RFB80720.1 hypothetical protein DYH55_04280 [Methylovirgula sp. 4M-Z18]
MSQVLTRLMATGPAPIDPAKRQVAAYVSPVPWRLKTAAGLIAVLTVVFFCFVTFALQSLQHVARTVGKDATDSIVLANEIRTDLSRAHTDYVNAVLMRTYGRGNAPGYWTRFQVDINAAEARLTEAAQNITYDGEKDAVVAMGQGVSQYARLVGRSYASGSSDTGPADAVMRTIILPAAERLNDVNATQLNLIYNDFLQRPWTFSLMALSGLALLLVLIATQVILLQLTHRIVNVFLALATLVLVGLGIYQISVVVGTLHALHVAKEDAFDSVDALWKARAYAYQVRFDAPLHQLASGDNARQARIAADMAAAKAKLLDKPADAAVQMANMHNAFGGFFGAELANITFEGEGAAALKMLQRWAVYDRVLGQALASNNASSLSLLVAFSFNDAEQAFHDFDDALGAVIDINQRAFVGAMQDVDAYIQADAAHGDDHQFQTFWYVALAACIVIVVLSGLGLKQRLDDYRF